MKAALPGSRLLRQYGEETLRSDPVSWRKAMMGHSAYYAGLVKEQGERMKGADQKEAFERIACDFENIRLAWRCLVEEGAGSKNQGYAVWALPLLHGQVDGIPAAPRTSGSLPRIS